jgi:hypothetical protein
MINQTYLTNRVYLISLSIYTKISSLKYAFTYGRDRVVSNCHRERSEAISSFGDCFVVSLLAMTEQDPRLSEALRP